MDIASAIKSIEQDVQSLSMLETKLSEAYRSTRHASKENSLPKSSGSADLRPEKQAFRSINTIPLANISNTSRTMAYGSLKWNKKEAKDVFQLITDRKEAQRNRPIPEDVPFKYSTFGAPSDSKTHINRVSSQKTLLIRQDGIPGGRAVDFGLPKIPTSFSCGREVKAAVSKSTATYIAVPEIPPENFAKYASQPCIEPILDPLKDPGYVKISSKHVVTSSQPSCPPRKSQYGPQRNAKDEKMLQSPTAGVASSDPDSSYAVLSKLPDLNTSGVGFMACQLVALSTRKDSLVFCPLCTDLFPNVSELHAHLRRQHRADLKLLLRKQYDVFSHQTCPACNVKVFKKGVLGYHVMKFHPEVVQTLLSSVSVDRGNLRCHYCDYSVEEDQLSTFVAHLEVHHSDQMEGIILNKLRDNTVSSCSIRSEDISLLLTKRSIRDSYVPSAAKRKSILLAPSTKVHRRKGSKAKRSLRFSVPESTIHLYTPPPTDSSSSTVQNQSLAQPKVLQFNSVSRDETSAVSSPMPSGIVVESLSACDTPPRPGLMCGLRRKKNKPQYSSTPLKSKSPIRSAPAFPRTPGRSPVKLFQCRVCHLPFGSNLLLLQHVRNWHKAVFFRPRYGCASCGAKFFKNRFLLRHVSVCHTLKQVMNSSFVTPKVIKCKLNFSGRF